MKYIILYDGYCPTCNFSVKLAARFDKNKNFYYSPLQSDLSQNFIKSNPELKDIDSIVLKIDDDYLIKSDAVFEIIHFSGPPIKYLYFLKYIPRSIRDWCYDRIAKNRFKLTGKYDTCQIPPSLMGRIVS